MAPARLQRRSRDPALPQVGPAGGPLAERSRRQGASSGLVRYCPTVSPLPWKGKDPERQARRGAANNVLAAARSHPGDTMAAVEQLIRIQAYQAWVLEGRPAEGPCYEAPLFCATGEALWPDDMPYAVAHTLSYVAQGLDLVPWSEIVLSMARRAADRDPGGAAELTRVVTAATSRFEDQYQHARAGLYDAQLADDPQQAVRRALNAYSAMYEIDMALWLLGVLAKADLAGAIKPKFLGGPDGGTAQGAMLNEVLPLLGKTPLELPFALTYDAVLRNAIGHNELTITTVADELEVSDRKTGQTWPGGEIHQRLMLADFMVQAVALTADLEMSGRPLPERDSGVLTFTCDVMDNDIPLVVVGQLDSFHRLDSVGAWVDVADLRFCVDGQVSKGIVLTDRALMPGDVELTNDFIRAVRSKEWVEIERLALAPDLGHGLPVIKSMSGESYEIVRPADRHYVRATIKS